MKFERFVSSVTLFGFLRFSSKHFQLLNVCLGEDWKKGKQGVGCHGGKVLALCLLISIK